MTEQIVGYQFDDDELREEFKRIDRIKQSVRGLSDDNLAALLKSGEDKSIIFLDASEGEYVGLIAKAEWRARETARRERREKLAARALADTVEVDDTGDDVSIVL